MPKQAYNYNFKMFMEGIEVPFESIQVMCTPNGVEASINLLSNRQVFDIKPKTAVQVFYRDWVPVDGKYSWRLMFDGFLSSYMKNDQATQGRGLAIVCRDFRMDIRKAPAALVFQPDPQDIGIETLFHTQGLFRTSVIRGNKGTSATVLTRVFDNTGLQSLGFVISLIAGTAYGGRKKTIQKQKKPEVEASAKTKKEQIKNKLNTMGILGSSIPKATTPSQGTPLLNAPEFSISNTWSSDTLSVITNQDYEVKTNYVNKSSGNGETIYEKTLGESMPEDSSSNADTRLFLDAVVRGLWTEAVGGTSISAFINRRIRVDKRFLIPANKTGYNFWSKQNASLNIGTVLLGNSKFTSVEAAIMRLAGLFSTRVYSCNTPSLIPLDENTLKWVMDEKVKKYLVDDHKKEFGGKYILNETMLLPPLEFTSPPNCNLFLPPMYDRVSWQYDIDGDVTRGYFNVIDTISTVGSNDLKGMSIQFPNALFNVYNQKNKTESKDKTGNAKQDEYGRDKPPITLEERYKGVSVYFGSVEDLLARHDATRYFADSTYKQEVVKKIKNKESEIKTRKNEILNKLVEKGILKNSMSKVSSESAQKEKEKKINSNRVLAEGGGYDDKNARNALNRHASLKFLNVKYAGRVAVVDMAFNPYPMSGFPGAIIVDDEAYGGESAKTIIGMVQQVKHMITITPSGGDATTSIILNNARFEDEPTDVDIHGNPLYMKETDPDKAKIDPNKKSYFTPDPEPIVSKDLDNKYYDLDDNKKSNSYIYAKDLITLSKKDIRDAKNNYSYLDDEYLPNRIHVFYKNVFSHKSEHFMIGEKTSLLDPTQRISFVYDTMHEAFTELRRNKKYLLSNYEECIKFVHRDICSADAFFQGILGCSVVEKVYDDTGKVTGTKLVVNEKNYKPDVIHKRYFGITTDDWDKDQRVKGLKDPSQSPTSNGLMTAAGQFSSIKEHLPLTAFIQERRDAVEAYLTKIEQRVEGVQFANIQRYPESE